jgi:hypothetical protein
MASNLQDVRNAVFHELQAIPYPRAITDNAILKDFFAQIEEQDNRTNVPIHRVNLFLYHLKTILGPFNLFRDDLVNPTAFPTVNDLVKRIFNLLP